MGGAGRAVVGFDAVDGLHRSVSTIVDGLVTIERMRAALAAIEAELVVDALEAKRLARDIARGDRAARSGDRPAGGWDEETIVRRELASEIGCAPRVSERSVQSLIGRSEALVASLPATHAALRSGAITARHARVIVEEAGTLPDAVMPAFETAALERADTSAARFTQRARTLRERMHPDSLTVRADAERERRHVRVEAARDGMAWLTAFLPAEQAVAIDTRLTAVARARRCGDDPGTIEQLRADILSELLIDGATTTVPAGIRPSVLVTVPVETLLGADTPADLEGHGPIDAATARALTAETPALFRLLVHPETRIVESIGRDSSVVPAALRRALRARDRRCRFPGCTAPAVHAEADHTCDYAHGGGATALNNLALLCRSHHHLKHQTGWSVEQRPGGRLVWTSPEGREYTDDTDPPPDAPLDRALA